MTKYQMPNETEASSGDVFSYEGGPPLPAEVDWRKYGYVTPVRKQVRGDILYYDQLFATMVFTLRTIKDQRFFKLWLTY